MLIGGVMNIKITNNKGFSLLEVLVGVSIIGIISAIAVPTYQNYSREASKTAADTTMANVVKAYNSCTVLRPASQCTSLSAINISCPDCTSSVDSTTNPTTFCASINKSAAGKNIRACVAVSGSTVTRTYGGASGDMFEGIKICHITVVAGGTCPAVAKTAMEGARECAANGDCGTDVAANAGANTCGQTYTCETTTDTGVCNTNGTCQ